MRQHVLLEIVLILLADIAQGGGERRSLLRFPGQRGARGMARALRRRQAVKALSRRMHRAVAIGIGCRKQEIAHPADGGQFNALGGDMVDILPLTGVGAIDERDIGDGVVQPVYEAGRSEEHTSELQSLMRISYAVFCLQKKILSIYNTKLKYHK